MRAFFRNLFAALFNGITWPFRMMFGIGGGGGGNAAAQHDAEADEADSRVAAVQAAVAPDTRLDDAMAVRRAARIIMRGESAAGTGADIIVRRWLHTLTPAQLAIVSRAQPEVLVHVMSGEHVDACPVPPFLRSRYDGSASASRPTTPRTVVIRSAEMSVDDQISAIIRNAFPIRP